MSEDQKQPFVVAFGLWQKQRLEDLQAADPLYFAEIDAEGEA